jgi:formylglycine-generating enzyme required for sulfatase activity
MKLYHYFPLVLPLAGLFFSLHLNAQKPAIEWVNIPAGTFMMGSPETEPGRDRDEIPHEVTLSPFKMSRYEVTLEQFKSFVDATGYLTDAEKETGGIRGSVLWSGTAWDSKPGVNWRFDEEGNPRPESDYDHPVVHVSWDDATAFAAWMGCRLPTEAEWEYACRAGTTTPFNTGEHLDASLANYKSDSASIPGSGLHRGGLKPVGSYPPNPWGLHDMHGNAWEWCSDWYGDYPAEAVKDPQGAPSGSARISRGGSWHVMEKRCRSANRNSNQPNYRISTMGFRLVSTD